MSSQKVAVVESEKSFKIFSTNWKEDLVLKRNLQVLDRSETTVVNRITVDQKILLRRFQTKLSRSKMSYARAMGNMRLQKSLREKTTFVLNTNIGQNEEQNDTLKRLWDKGRKSYEDRINSDSYLRKKKSKAFTCFGDESENETPKQEIHDTRPYTAVNVRPNTTVVFDLSTSRKVASAPPERAVPQETNEPVLGVLDTAVEQLEATRETVNEKNDLLNASSERKPRPQTARPYVHEFSESKEPVAARRPSTAAGCLPSTTVTDNKEASEKPAAVPLSARRRKKSARQPKPVTLPTTNAGLGSMFEDNSFEISLVDFQRFCVHSANYETRVQKYGERIKPLKTSNGQPVDIYTLGISESIAKSRKSLQMEAVHEATPEDIKRATGNLTVRNLTLKDVEKGNHKQLPHIT